MGSALQERWLAYVLAIRADVTAYPFDTKPEPRPARARPADGPSPATATEHPPWRPSPRDSGERLSLRSPGATARAGSYVMDLVSFPSTAGDHPS